MLDYINNISKPGFHVMNNQKTETRQTSCTPHIPEFELWGIEKSPHLGFSRSHKSKTDSHGSRQFFNRGVFVPAFRLSAPVNLQADDAKLRDCVVRLGVIEGLIAVEPGAQPFAFTADDVFVPLAPL